MDTINLDWPINFKGLSIDIDTISMDWCINYKVCGNNQYNNETWKAGLNDTEKLANGHPKSGTT